VPRIAGCMELSVGVSVQCRCSDQAGADLEVDLGTCTQVVRHGVFDPSRKYGDAKAENVAYLNATRPFEPMARGGGEAGSVPAVQADAGAGASGAGKGGG